MKIKKDTLKFVLILIVPLFILSFLFQQMAVASMLAVTETAENVQTTTETREIYKLKLIEDTHAELTLCDLDMIECEGQAPKGDSKEDVKRLIEYYAKEYKIQSDLPMRIAFCESGFRADARNAHSSATGVYQWINSSFAANCEGEQLNADDNVECGVRIIAEGRIHHWNASKACWG